MVFDQECSNRLLLKETAIKFQFYRSIKTTVHLNPKYTPYTIGVTLFCESTFDISQRCPIHVCL